MPFSLTFYIYYKAILKLFQISICGNADENEVAARWMRPENLTKFFKFRTNVRSWKFDFKSQILGGLPRNMDAAPFRRTDAAPSQLPSAAPGRTKSAAAPRGRAAAPTQLPNAAPYPPPSAARGRGIRTFVRNVCSPTDRSVVRDL